VLLARLPGTLDQRLDGGVVLEVDQVQGLLARDERRHGTET
jgi:hypothetical protein